uniref:Uncharacterized protein n=1 Tax=Gasterosteus aculeatus TaxID=69293 RepID=G3NWM2_GASAC
HQRAELKFITLRRSQVNVLSKEKEERGGGGSVRGHESSQRDLKKSSRAGELLTDWCSEIRSTKVNVQSPTGKEGLEAGHGVDLEMGGGQRDKVCQ